MKQILICLFLLLSITASSQNVTIDYEAWNPSGTTCSLFVNATSVPASGTSTGSIEHQRKLGEVLYSSSDLSLQIKTIYEETAAVSRGGRFRIAYSFKAGYNYMVYVTAAADQNTLGYGTGPYIRIDANNSNGGGSTGCNGPEIVNANYGGNPAAVQLTSNNFQEFQFVLPAPGTASTLEVTAFPAKDGGTKTVRVRKIRIVETLSSATFTLSPSSVPITCGSTTAQTFTVTNVNNTPGVTGYTWNLGSSNNGWLYNGNPAPQTITGTTNTLTLTPACGAVQSSVTVNVSANGAVYNTNTASVSATMPFMAIAGDDLFCSNTSVYTISNIPCNATVVWDASSSAVNLSPSGSTVTVAKVSNEVVTLTANVSSCNTVSLSKTITVGVAKADNITAGSTIGTGEMQGIPFYYNGLTYWEPFNNKYLEFESLDGHFIYPNPANELGSNFPYHARGAQVIVDTRSGSGGGSIYLRVRAVNDCGASEWRYFSVLLNSGYYFLISPNPASGTITVQSKEGLKTSITSLALYDGTGMVKKQVKFGAGIGQAKLNVTGLNAGIYVLEIANGQSKERQQLIIQK